MTQNNMILIHWCDHTEYIFILNICFISFFIILTLKNPPKKWVSLGRLSEIYHFSKIELWVYILKQFMQILLSAAILSLLLRHLIYYNRNEPPMTALMTSYIAHSLTILTQVLVSIPLENALVVNDWDFSVKRAWVQHFFKL